MELQAITGILHIIEGEKKEDAAPGLLAQRAPKKPARGREEDFLFVHLTLDTPPADAPDALTQDLLDALVKEFYQTTGSVISALRRAILHINSLLLRWNVNSSGRSRDGAISCAVLRNNELYLVQVGEALAFIGRNFGVERIPANPPEVLTPLGRSANLEFRFGHYRLQPADMLLLTEPVHNHLPASVFQPALVDTEVEIGLEELTDLVGSSSARLMLLEFSDEPPIDFPAIAQLTQKLPKPASILENMPTVRMPKREDGQPLVGRQQVENSARQATAQAAIGLSKASEGVADMLRQLQPEEPEEPAEPRPHWAIPTAMAIIIPIIVIAIVMSVYFQYGQVAEFSQLRQDMSQALGLAQQAEDENEARQYYNQVLILAAQAEQIRPGETTVATQREEAIRAIDRLDGITRLIATPLHTYPEESRLSAVELQSDYDLNGNIYVLDRGIGQVTRHRTDPITLLQLEEEPDTLVFSGQAIQNHVVGNMVDLLWRPSGSSVTRDGITILDSRGQLITFYTNFEDIRTTPFDLSSEWRNPVGLIGFSERVYVIDNEAQRVWRYFPNGDELQIQQDSPAIEFGVEANLNLVVSADINEEDGSVILLYADGQLRRYSGGRVLWTENDLQDGGLVTPLIQPAVVRIVGQGLNSSIFVLDPGSGRLLQFSLGGILLAQYRATDANGLELLARASDFAIAEDPLRVFITADNQLHVATLE